MKRTCTVCAREFEPYNHRITQFYCCESCKNRAYIQRRRKRRLAEPHARQRLHLGTRRQVGSMDYTPYLAALLDLVARDI